MVLVAGSDKAEALRQVLQRKEEEALLPAAQVRAAETLWLVDRAAAERLDLDDPRIGDLR
jgi:6-phosphogluconolactonase/glucosamine-6-phosphate isomerase/deaminase